VLVEGDEVKGGLPYSTRGGVASHRRLAAGINRSLAATMVTDR
jgi:hypothetical protein